MTGFFPTGHRPLRGWRRIATLGELVCLALLALALVALAAVLAVTP